jgi:hypothetical protein
MGSVLEDAVKKHKNKDDTPGYGSHGGSQYGSHQGGPGSSSGGSLMGNLGGFFKK